MKPILVLTPERAGASPRQRRHVHLHHVVLNEDGVANDAAYSSVIVVNDGSAGTIRRLLQALELRRRRKRLCVGVLTYVGDTDHEHQATRLQGLGPEAPHLDNPLPGLVNLGSRLRIELREEVLRFEYQAP